MNLTNHFVLENFFLVKNFDSYMFTSFNMSGKLDLCKISFAKRPAQLILPCSRPLSAVAAAGVRRT
jgi:hypothetical protein